MSLPAIQISDLERMLKHLWGEWLQAAAEGKSSLALELRVMYLAMYDRRHGLVLKASSVMPPGTVLLAPEPPVCPEHGQMYLDITSTGEPQARYTCLQCAHVTRKPWTAFGAITGISP